jgi:hypothetical protein
VTYFPEDNPKPLYQDKMIEILYQTMAEAPKWHEPMANANIKICEMSPEKSVSDFKLLENLGNISYINVLAPPQTDN